MHVNNRAHLPSVSDTVTGEDIKRRRVAAGLDLAELAREARVSRTTLTNIEAGGSARDASFGKVLRALEEAEDEGGDVRVVPSEPPEVEVIEFEVEGAFGVRVIKARGPITAHETLRNDVIAIIQGIQSRAGESQAE